MDQKSPASSMESTGDTSRLLKELMDLQKSTGTLIQNFDLDSLLIPNMVLDSYSINMKIGLA